MQYIPRYKVTLIREGSIKCVSKNIDSPRTAYEIIKSEIEDLDREQVVALFLDVKNKVIAFNVVSTGILTASTVHPRELFKPAILCNSASVIVAHNHPSGDVTPSDDDIRTTKRLVEAGKLLGIEVLDHLVVNDYKFYSLKENNHF